MIMCGRFTLEKSIGDLATLFQLPGMPDLPGRYNIAPTQWIAAIRLAEETGERELALLRWGLIPAWAKEPGAMPLLINARSETAATKPAFRAALRRRRCLVPADGFYEWQRQGSLKQPFHMRRRDGEPFALAGLWERWEGPDGIIDSCALLTTSANELMIPIHDRMPVILDREQFDLWLDPSVQDVHLIQDLLRPYPPEAMIAYPVQARVNNARNDDPQCVLPLE
jgi:putative SOS response-associated peptidase YedK